MFSVVPTCAAPLAEKELHALVGSAKAAAAVLSPHLTVRRADGTTVTHTIRKVVSCRHHYSALLRSDGTLLLLLLRQSAGVSPRPGSDAAPSDAARISVLASGGEAVRDVAAGAYHIVYCTVSGAVYTCGYDNTYGQLGDGTVWSASCASSDGGAAVVGDVPPLSSPKRIAGFGDRGAAGAAGNGWSSTDTSSSFTEDAAGNTQEAGAEPSAAAKHQPLPCNRNIRHVCCGAHHSLLLTQTGRCVYACGRGDHGQLGSARAVLVQPTFRSIALLFGLKMRQVAAADTHSFALLANGVLFGFGDNVCGQLGLGHTQRALLPTFVPLPDQRSSSEGIRPTATATTTTASGRQVLDERAYASLRAPYGSAASTYYPLRVPRLQTDVGGGVGGASHSPAAATVDVCVTRVHCCASWTLLETSRPDLWLSCGVALTRGVAPAAAVSRIDGCGVLGRALQTGRADEAHRFLPVQWPALLRAGRGSWEVKAAPPEWAQEEGVDGAPFRVLEVQRHSERHSERDEEGASHTRCVTTATTAIGESGTIQQSASSDPRRRGSDTELSLCHTKKTVKGDEAAEGDVRVAAYATTLLVLPPDEGGWSESADEHAEPRLSRLLVQSGTPSAVAAEVSLVDPAAWSLVTGNAADVEGAVDDVDPMQRVPSGASLLNVRSSHRQFIPLPRYALFL